MIAKTLTGIPFVDDHYGGTYRGRAMLVSGRSNCGKSVFGLQFLNQGIHLGECGLLLSVRPAADVAIFAEALGLPIGMAVENGSAIVLEYSGYLPGKEAEQHLSLPPEGFVQLQEIIKASGVQRVVLDTCLPWISRLPADQLAQQVFSFVRSFDRLGTTTLMTMPKPISPIAFKLKSILEGIVPVVLTLSLDTPGEKRGCVVNKYLGEKASGEEIGFTIERDRGIVALAPQSVPPDGAHDTPRSPRTAVPLSSWPAPDASHAAGPPPPAAARKAPLTPGHPSPSTPARSGPVRFSSMFRPNWPASKP